MCIIFSHQHSVVPVSESVVPDHGFLRPGRIVDSTFFQVAALREDLAAAKAAQQSLQRQLAGKGDEGRTQEAQLQALQQALAKAEAAHAASQQQLTARLADQSSQGAELEALQQRHAATQQAEYRQRDQLEQQAAAAAAAQAQLATLQGELRTLQGTHSALQEQARQHQEATQSREADVAQLRQQQAATAAEREAEARALQQQLESARAAAAFLQVHAPHCAGMCLCRQLLQKALLPAPQLHCAVLATPDLLSLNIPSGAAVCEQCVQEQCGSGAGAPAAAADICPRRGAAAVAGPGGHEGGAACPAAAAGGEKDLSVRGSLFSAWASLPWTSPKILKTLEARSASAAAEGEETAMNPLVDQKGLRAVHCR